MWTIIKRLTATVAIVLFVSCTGDEYTEEINYDVDLNLAKETNWAMADAILVLVNQHRISIGISAIQSDPQFGSAYAVEHTKYMIEKERISHDNFNLRREALKNKGAKIVGENVAFGYFDAESVMHAWLSSPGHRKIIEGFYSHLGFGIIQNDDGNNYFTLLFYRM